MNNIFFKTLFKRGAKGAKGEKGTSYEVPTNGIIGFDDEDGELDIPAGYDDATIPPYLIEKTIKANGTYDASYEGAFGYSNVNVDIDGDVPTLIAKNITANGEYSPADDDADGYSSVKVKVLNPQTILVPKSITENGTYNPADDNADGYSSVAVNVASGGGVDGLYFDGTDVNTLRVIPLSENKDIEIEIDFYLPSYQNARMILGNTANGYYPVCFMNDNKFTVNTGGSQIYYAPPNGFVGNHNLILNRFNDRAIILDGVNIGTYTRQLVGQAPALDIGRALSIGAAEFVLNYLKITDYSTGEVLADYKAGFRALSNGYKIPCLLNTIDDTYIDLNTGRPSGNNEGHIMVCQNPS